MRYAIKVNHFSFRFARCRLVSRVAFPSFRAVTLIAIHTKSNLVPLRPAHRFECPPPLHPFDYCLCCLLLASSLSFLFFCCLCPLGTFNFWRSFVVIFLDMRYSILCTVCLYVWVCIVFACLFVCMCVCVYSSFLLAWLTVCCWYLARLASIYVLFAVIVEFYLFLLSFLPFFSFILKDLFGCGALAGSHLAVLLYW